MLTHGRKKTVPRTVAPTRPSTHKVEAAGPTTIERAPDGLVLGRLTGFADGLPLILLPGKRQPIAASTTGTVSETHIDKLVAVMFIESDLAKPVVVGAIVAMPESETAGAPQRMELAATSELVLKCGPATLRLLADGTAVLRGVNVVTRASATNRIRGGNVQIN